MQGLLINSELLTALVELDIRASASVIDYDTMLLTMRAMSEHSREEIAAKNKALTIAVPIGYTVTLTYEEQPSAKYGHRICRHASIGLRTKPGHGPNPEAVLVILKGLGFKTTMNLLPKWLEPLEDGTFAVNAIEPVSGDLSELLA